MNPQHFLYESLFYILQFHLNANFLSTNIYIKCGIWIIIYNLYKTDLNSN